MAFSREQFLAANDCEIIEVQAPRMSEPIRLKAFSGKKRERYMQWVTLDDGHGGEKFDVAGYQAKMVILSAVNEEGRDLFSEGDFEALMEKDANIVAYLADEIQRLSALGEESVEEKEKN